MKQNKYGEILNDIKTYQDIAKALIKDNVIISWIDEDLIRLDILFSYKAVKESGNYLQRGIKGNELFISIIGAGAFGFDVNNSEKASGYIAQKLNINGEPTVEKLGELINGVIKELNNNR